uniref:Sorting nexin-29-like n=1 Tax=Phallusia mammillata TaxID=59560 RepID=A0A6F9DTF1_9ASCI|nr:sorting nexin-29-like [Phallusia mammillata]
MDPFKQERQSLHARLLDAVRECQTHLTNNQQQLASEQSSWVSCLCSQIETVLQHRLKKASGQIIGGFQLTNPAAVCFWPVIKFHLTSHEIKRFEDMVNITNDFGRGRAWIRCSLNEGSLERYFHMIIGNVDLLKSYYEEEAFLLDQEFASTLPHMAAGLSAIYFNLKFNDPALNGSLSSATAITPNNLLQSMLPSTFPIKPSFGQAEEVTTYREASLPAKVKKRSGKKKRSTIISFGDDDSSFSAGTFSSHKQKSNGDSSYLRKDASETTSYTTEQDSLVEETESDLSRSLCDLEINDDPTIAVTASIGIGTLQFKDVPHDIVMDDWSRTSSVSGLMSPEETKPAESFVVKNRCESIPETSIPQAGSSSKVSVGSTDLPISNSLHGNQREVQQTNQREVQYTAKKENKLSSEDLQKALNAVVHRKEEIEESNKSLRALLDSEMLLSAELRMKVSNLEAKLKQKDLEHEAYRVESERNTVILRKQLKSYIDGMKAIGKHDAIAANDVTLHPTEDNEIDSQSYEQKLTEVAEMHGELLEFNERLQMRLQCAITLLKSNKEELTSLRGPMARDDLVAKIESDDISEPISNLPASHALINIWIPSAIRQGKPSQSYYAYQVYIRIGTEEWNVYRRYSQFRELHKHMQKRFHMVETFHFPPKKVVGNTDTKFVEDRRKKLQSYLRLLLNNIIQNHERIVAKPEKPTLTALLPFFSETVEATAP